MPQVTLQEVFLAAQVQSEMPTGTLLSFDKSLLVSIGIQWFNVAVLTAVLIFVLYKPVKTFMDERAERIRNEIDAARREREEAFEFKEKYEQLIKEMEKERRDILLAAHKKAMEKSDQMLIDARQKSDAIYESALMDIEIERKNVLNDMKKQMIEISLLVAGRFVETSIDRETQDRLIEEAFSDWEGS